MNWFYELFIENFQGCIWLACILLAMIPALEAKIAIPFAMNPAFWGNNALPAWQACIFAFIGSILPSLAIIYFTRFCKSKTSGFLVNSKKFSVKVKQLNNKSSNFKKYLTLCGFVALPLPLTGVWTGSLVAGISNLKIWKCIISIFIGALISCILMTLICVFFSNSIGTILIISLCLIIVFLAIDLFITLIKKKS